MDQTLRRNGIRIRTVAVRLGIIPPPFEELFVLHNYQFMRLAGYSYTVLVEVANCRPRRVVSHGLDGPRK
jgi:hypothetical protein